MLMAVTITALRSALTDITDMHRTPALRMATMARHGLAVESLLEQARGIGMPIMAVVMGTAIVVAMAMAMVTDMGAAMDMGMATDMAVANTTAATGAASMVAVGTTAVEVFMVAVASTVVAVMAVADGSFHWPSIVRHVEDPSVQSAEDQNRLHAAHGSTSTPAALFEAGRLCH